MELKLIKETNFTDKDISDFIERTPCETFETIKYWRSNFLEYIKRLYDENFIMVYTDGELRGICLWFFTDEENKMNINKIKWTLPKDIKNGDILYVGTCILTHGCNIFDMKKKFEEMGVRERIKEILWFSDKKIYRKGTVKCASNVVVG